MLKEQVFFVTTNGYENAVENDRYMSELEVSRQSEPTQAQMP